MTKTNLPPNGPDLKLPAQGGLPINDEAAELLAKWRRDARRHEAEKVAKRQGWTLEEAEAALASLDRTAAEQRDRAAAAVARDVPTPDVRRSSATPADTTRRVEQLDAARPIQRPGEIADASRSASPADASRQVRRQHERSSTKVAARVPEPRQRPRPAPRIAIARRSGMRPLSQARRENHARRVADAQGRGAVGWSPEQIPIEVQGTHRAIELDHTGARARAALESFPRRLRSYRRAIERIALGMDTHTIRDGNLVAIPPRPADFSDIRSRRIIAYAYSIFLLSRTTTRRGFSRVVKGYSRGALASLSINAHDGVPCTIEYIFATSHDAVRRLFKHEHGEAIPITPRELAKLERDTVVTGRDDCGPMVALDRGGALLFNQPPAHDSEPEYLGIPKPRMVAGVLTLVRNALNVYWLRKGPPPRPPS